MSKKYTFFRTMLLNRRARLYLDSIIYLFLLTSVDIASSFVSIRPSPTSVLAQPQPHRIYEIDRHSVAKSRLNAESESPGASPSATSLRPLYDGTNYTFPDTATPAGIAELLEISFVKSCMQLASGYVDVLKLFIAVSVAGYEQGFSILSLEAELSKCSRQTANRPLMPEEQRLRYHWLCIVYLTLEAMRHPTAADLTVPDELSGSIPTELREEYSDVFTQIGNAFRSDEPIPPVDSLLMLKSPSGAAISEVEKAVMSQSLRVATLTPVVIEDSREANRDNSDGKGVSIDPPKPPIKGAFD